MSRKHFEAIAAGLREARPEVSFGEAFAAWNVAVDALVAVMKRQNGRFDEARFRAACGA